MSYWQTHVKVCKEEDAEYGADIELDEFKLKAPLFLEKNKHLVTRQLSDSYMKFYFFKDEISRRNYLNGEEPMDFQRMFIGTIEELATQTRQLEEELNLTACDRKYFEEKDYEDYSYGMIEYITAISMTNVIYINILGNNNFLMSPGIKNHFRKGGFYFNKSDVIKASNFLDGNREDLHAIHEEFRTAFIDSFVEGESIFQIDWAPYSE